ncbi:MAG: type II secretion system GspH family protein [Actinobacteria bacterium]|nr:type II secretion system GspH family protein [Actinomycetota bacterium]
MKRILKVFADEVGFTLIELLVVVTILAILVSIALLSVSVTTKRAQEAACLTNLRTFISAIKAYEAENTPNLPPDLETLVTDGYMKSIPNCPAGGAYDYNAETGDVSCPHGHHL